MLSVIRVTQLVNERTSRQASPNDKSGQLKTFIDQYDQHDAWIARKA